MTPSDFVVTPLYFLLAYVLNLRHFHLGLLTKKFINLIKQAEDGILDLNKAADTLEVTMLLEHYRLLL